MDLLNGDKSIMETLDSAHMRVLNSSTLLKMIWRDREISRADISQRTGMSRSTVSTIVADLIRRGLVTETGTGHSNGGRRPVILSFNEDAYSVLGIDIGWDRLRVAVTNLRAGVRHWWQEECPVQNDPDRCIGALFAMVQRAKNQCSDDGKPLIGVGLGLPSPMQEDFFPKWKGVQLGNLLRDKIHLPLALEKDANLGALAEYWWKDPKGAGNIAYINSQRSVGLIFEGRMHRGSHGLAGDLAQFGFQPKNPLDDHPVQQIVQNLLSLLDLDTVVIDPQLLGRSEERLDALRLSVMRQLRGLTYRTPRIDFGSMNDRQVALGASTQILSQALDDFTIFPAIQAVNFPWSWSRESSPSL